jgi:small subunit ribosomal protein S6
MNIPKNKIKRKYELTYLIPGTYTESEVSKFKEKIDQIIAKYDGEIETTEEWGKKKLAYRISDSGKTYNEAYYIHQILEFETGNTNKFEKSLKLNQNVIRYLLVLVTKGNSSYANKQSREEE